MDDNATISKHACGKHSICRRNIHQEEEDEEVATPST
jgi:hypothetical protein